METVESVKTGMFEVIFSACLSCETFSRWDFNSIGIPEAWTPIVWDAADLDNRNSRKRQHDEAPLAQDFGQGAPRLLIVCIYFKG